MFAGKRYNLYRKLITLDYSKGKDDGVSGVGRALLLTPEIKKKKKRFLGCRRRGELQAVSPGKCSTFVTSQ